MSLRVDEHKVKLLPKVLQCWAIDVEHKARFTDQSFHDSLCDIQEEKSIDKQLSKEDCITLMEAMDSYWD